MITTTTLLMSSGNFDGVNLKAMALETVKYLNACRTAQGKKQENIAEYILYMWQIEDQIRADWISTVSRLTSLTLPTTEPVKASIRSWYESLIEMMRLEGVAEKDICTQCQCHPRMEDSTTVCRPYLGYSIQWPS